VCDGVICRRWGLRAEFGTSFPCESVERGSGVCAWVSREERVGDGSPLLADEAWGVSDGSIDV